MWIPGKGMGVSQNFQKIRVRVWKCHRTHRISGYCGTGLPNSQKFRAGTKHAVPVPRVLWHGSYRTHRSSGYGYESLTQLPEVPGTGIKVLQTSRSSRYGYESLTELPEVPGVVARAYRTHTSSGGRYENAVPVPQVFVALAYITYRSSGCGCECPTELTKVPGTGNTQVNTRPRGRSSI